MSAADQSVVLVETRFRLVDPDTGKTITVRVDLQYDTADPYAVKLLFHPEFAGGEVVDWLFARELALRGLEEHAGIGDVRIWPLTAQHGDFVALALSSLDGNALFEIRRSALTSFLRRTYRAVPRGQEADYLDIDKFVTKLFPTP